MNIIKCYIDQFECLRAESCSEVLSMYLEQDIQGSATVCDIVIEACNKVICKEIPEWSGTGNAHTITICSKNVIIKNYYTDSIEPLQLSPQDFIAALKEWKRCIKIRMRGNKDGEIPIKELKRDGWWVSLANYRSAIEACRNWRK